MTNDGDFTHGTTGYSHHKCRCPVCRAAVAEYNRKRQKAKRDGTWKPGRYVAPKLQCQGPDCDRTAKVKNPLPLCNSHALQLWRGAELSPIRTYNRAVDGMKRCAKCGGAFPLEMFDKQSGRQVSQCKPCLSIYTRARRYGLSFDEMKALMEQSCAGCGATGLTGKNLHIDHCHTSGGVRGILCRSCNLILTEHVTPETLRRLAAYLESAS